MSGLFNIYDDKSVEERLLEKLEDYTHPQVELPHIKRFDKWLCSSALQKSIRRGYKESTLNMGMIFLHYYPDYIWRRLLVIIYEDIGIGNP